MASSIATGASLNLSKEIHSSSPRAIEYVQVENTVDVVEDSVKDIAEAYRGGAVQSPQPGVQQGDSDDELYSVSPEAKAASQRRRESTAKTTSHASVPSQRHEYGNATGGGSTVVHVNEEQQRQPVQAWRTLVDEQPPRGAEAHQTVATTIDNDDRSHAAVTSLKSSDLARPHTDERLRALDKTQDDNGRQATVRGSQAQGYGLTTQPNQDSAPAKINAPNARPYKPAAGDTASSLAALQARRNAANRVKANPGDGSDGITQKPPTKETTSTKSIESNISRRSGAPRAKAKGDSSYSEGNKARGTTKVPFRPGGNPSQTPARQTKHEQPPLSQRPQSPGKLRSKKNAGFTKNAVRLPGLKDDPISDGSNIQIDNRTARERDKVTEGGRASLKRPAKDNEPNDAIRDAPFDIPYSPDDQGAKRPVKKTRVDAPSRGKSTSKPTAKAGPDTRKAPVKGSTSTSGTESGPTRGQPQKSTAPTASGSRRPNVRTRLMAQNESGSTVNNVETPADNINKTSAAAKSNDMKRDAAQEITRKNESLEEFEHSVMNYEDDNVEKSMPDANVNEEILAAETPIPPIEADRPLAEKADTTEDQQQRAQDVNARQGASEENAIVLSDRVESSSPLVSSPPPPPPPEVASAKVPHRTSASIEGPPVPKTPPVFQSSPPWPEKVSTMNLHSLLDDSARRPTIISFDKSGPRNQGPLSVKNGYYPSKGNDRSSFPPANKALASVAGGRASLEAGRGNAPSPTATSVKSFNTTRAAPPSNIAGNVVDALAGFTEKSHAKTERETSHKTFGTMSVQDAEQAQMSLAPTDDDGFAAIEDFEQSTFITQDTVPLANYVAKPKPEPSDSQKAMPAPASKPSKSQRSHRAPTVPSMVSHGMIVPERESQETGPSVIPSKRGLDTSASEGPERKRVRVEEEGISDSTHALVSKVDNESLNTKGKTDPPLKSEIAPAKRDSRKPSRVASHGSQKVDMHGSPVPGGMTVPDESTALEEFSQQAGLSSDAELEELTFERHTTADSHFNPTALGNDAAPPSREAELLSSNTKSVPAAPYEESRAITGFARADQTGERVQNLTERRPCDPFTSSAPDSQQRKTNTSSSTFTDKLRKATAKPQPQMRAAPRLSSLEEDPDKTLVELERPFREFRREAARSSSSSSETSSGSQGSSSARHDLAIWRNALQPHQMNLFDELVIVSHRLVQNLVDRETAAANIVDAYRRRGQRLVEQMEQSHAEQLLTRDATFQQRKKRLRKNFSDYGKKLKACMASIAADGDDDSEEDDMGGIDVEMLRGIMNEYC